MATRQKQPRKKRLPLLATDGTTRSGAWIDMPPALKDRLKSQAAYETSVHPLGNNVSIRDLCVAIIDEGLRVREAARRIAETTEPSPIG